MKVKSIVWIVLLITKISIGQNDQKFLNEFLLGDQLKNENVLTTYNLFDFSTLWKHTKNDNILGIIGKNHQRIRIKIISIERDTNDPNIYDVYGKSLVKGTICDFRGKIELKLIKEVKEFHFGIDDEYKSKGIKAQGVAIASYYFKEDKNQKHSGFFTGKLYSRWYMTSNNQIKYDDIEFISDGYFNNAFVGVWKSYKTNKGKMCNWADFRVPNANQDFDIGAGEFSPNPKYYEKGWADYSISGTKDWWK